MSLNCNQCGQVAAETALKKCSACKLVYYCDAKCKHQVFDLRHEYTFVVLDRSNAKLVPSFSLLLFVNIKLSFLYHRDTIEHINMRKPSRLKATDIPLSCSNKNKQKKQTSILFKNSFGFSPLGILLRILIIIV